MSKEIVNKIREAEAEAQKIRADALEEAKARVKNAEDQGKKLCENAQARAEKENKEKIAVARTRSDELLAKTREEAFAEVGSMREAAEFNMREAVRFIISGVNEQCQ